MAVLVGVVHLGAALADELADDHVVARDRGPAQRCLPMTVRDPDVGTAVEQDRNNILEPKRRGKVQRGPPFGRCGFMSTAGADRTDGLDEVQTGLCRTRKLLA